MSNAYMDQNHEYVNMLAIIPFFTAASRQKYSRRKVIAILICISCYDYIFVDAFENIPEKIEKSILLDRELVMLFVIYCGYKSNIETYHN